jgi:hypothetical protein
VDVRRRGRSSAGVAAGLVVVLLFGCSAPSPFDAASSTPGDDGGFDERGPADGDTGMADDDPGDGAEPDSGGDGDADPDAPTGSPDDTPTDPEARVCNDAVVAAAGATIDSQLDALGEADFDRALSFASRRFQAEVDLDNFEAIISAQYPILLDEARAEYGRCAQVDDLARMEVTVTGTDGARDALVYLLVREEGRWSIDGAASVDQEPRELV